MPCLLCYSRCRHTVRCHTGQGGEQSSRRMFCSTRRLACDRSRDPEKYAIGTLKTEARHFDSHAERLGEAETRTLRASEFSNSHAAHLLEKRMKTQTAQLRSYA